METITVDLPVGFKASDKWRPGSSTDGKFMLQFLPFETVTVSGEAKEQDGSMRKWEYEQLALVSDGKKAYSGGQEQGRDHRGRPVTVKTLVKLMPPPSSGKSSPAVSVSKQAGML